MTSEWVSGVDAVVLEGLSEDVKGVREGALWGRREPCGD